MRRAVEVIGWIVVLALAAFGFFCLLCLALGDPLTPSPTAKPVSSPAVQVVGRWA